MTAHMALPGFSKTLNFQLVNSWINIYIDIDIYK